MTVEEALLAWLNATNAFHAHRQEHQCGADCEQRNTLDYAEIQAWYTYKNLRDQ